MFVFNLLLPSCLCNREKHDFFTHACTHGQVRSKKRRIVQWFHTPILTEYKRVRFLLRLLPIHFRKCMTIAHMFNTFSKRYRDFCRRLCNTFSGCSLRHVLIHSRKSALCPSNTFSKMYRNDHFTLAIHSRRTWHTHIHVIHSRSEPEYVNRMPSCEWTTQKDVHEKCLQS